MKRILLAALLGAALAGSSVAHAQQQASPRTAVSVSPAAQPTPALKYTLMPELKDFTSGNALLHYYKAFSKEWWSNINRQNVVWHENSDKAQVAPLDKMPAEYAFVKDWRMLREVDRGARTDHCDWELLDGLRKEGFGLLLPDLQGFREMVRFLALRARYELADGDFDKCIYTLQTGFALAKHVGEGPTLIHMLVGVAISQIMAKQLDELIQQPNCPNLYWALARLPRPYIDLRRPFQAEMMMTATLFPEFEELKRGPLPLDQAQKYMDEFIQRCKQWGIANVTPKDIAMQALAVYPKAKAALVQGGRNQAEVDAMPVPQVLLLHSAEVFYALRDDLFKWAPLPYPEAYQGMNKSAETFHASKDRGDVLPIVIELAPATHKVMQASVRADRRFAMLRIVEALRMHAAAHDGQLPAKLADVTEVPIPPDPCTGKAFEYAVTGNKATLSGPAFPGELPQYAMVYEVTMKK